MNERERERERERAREIEETIDCSSIFPGKRDMPMVSQLKFLGR